MVLLNLQVLIEVHFW